MREWIGKIPQTGWLYFLSLAIATVGSGIIVDRAAAQATYYERPISTTLGTGIVSTSSGIGVNIRSGPGLGNAVIGGAEDGNYLELVGGTRYADGYTWQQVSTGGWVATEYVNGGRVDVSYGDGCLRPVSACGGDAQTVRPISVRPRVRPVSLRPISTGAGGAYVVAVPGGDARTVAQVRRVVGGAYVDKAREGTFVNAGGYGDYESARSVSSLLRSNGLDARVIYK